MLDELCFDDLTPIEIPVKIKDQSYTLIEATGDVVSKYRTALSRLAKIRDGQAEIVGNVGDTDLLLLSLCLKDSGGALVSVDTLRGWKGSVVQKLVAKLKEISLLDQEESEADLQRRLEDTQRRLTALKEGKDPAKKLQSSGVTG